MHNWFYYDAAGTKQGPVNDAQLKALVKSGIITQETNLETESGHRGKAGQVRGLFTPNPAPFTSAPQAPAQTPQAPAPASVFCTNCGNPVEENAYACMKCGASPVGHNKFCRRCGAQLNPEQIVCIKCGTGVNIAQNQQQRGGYSAPNAALGPQGPQGYGGPGYGGPGYGRSGAKEPKNKLTAGLLAILLGGIGVHKFYMGSWGWGIVFIAIVLLTGGFGGIATGTCALVEGIIYLTMSQDRFNEKYPPETEAPFRW